jgi:predicted metal-dependent enzyme (double-stranded beta helix superfamily)
MKKLIKDLQNIVKKFDEKEAPHQVKNILEHYIQSEKICCEENWLSCVAECYARRLVHKDESGFVIVAMTWGPGQGTPVHDHCNAWCVECVVEGEIEVVQYDLKSKEQNHYFFEEQKPIIASFGDAGALIPPYEYHLIRNISKEPAVTLHVYAKEMTDCSIFIPEENGYRRETKQLCYQ